MKTELINKELITDFENMLKNSELRAIQKISLKQPLNHEQFTRFKELANAKIQGDF